MPLEEEGELFLSFDFFYNFVSFLKLQTLQGFNVICAWSSVKISKDSVKILKTWPTRPLFSKLTWNRHLMEFLRLFF